MCYDGADASGADDEDGWHDLNWVKFVWEITMVMTCLSIKMIFFER